VGARQSRSGHRSLEVFLGESALMSAFLAEELPPDEKILMEPDADPAPSLPSTLRISQSPLPRFPVASLIAATQRVSDANAIAARWSMCRVSSALLPRGISSRFFASSHDCPVPYTTRVLLGLIPFALI